MEEGIKEAIIEWLGGGYEEPYGRPGYHGEEDVVELANAILLVIAEFDPHGE